MKKILWNAILFSILVFGGWQIYQLPVINGDSYDENVIRSFTGLSDQNPVTKEAGGPYTNEIYDGIKEHCKKTVGTQLGAGHGGNGPQINNPPVPAEFSARGQNSTRFKDCGENDGGQTKSPPYPPPKDDDAKKRDAKASEAFSTLLDKVMEGQSNCYPRQEGSTSRRAYERDIEQCRRDEESAFEGKIRDIYNKMALDEATDAWNRKNLDAERHLQQVQMDKVQNCQMRQTLDEIAAKPLCP